MAVTVRMYADRKGWKITTFEVKLRHGRIQASDCDDCVTEKGMVDEIHADVRIEGELDDAQRARLLVIAGKCPIHKMLTSEIKIRTHKQDAS